MIALKAADGTTTTIGNFGAGGYPSQTTWGDPIRTVDPGVPLRNYQSGVSDPLTIWKNQPSVRKVIGFAARQVGSIPWHAYQRVNDTDRHRKQQSKAERLLAAPSRFRTGYNLWETVAVDKMLYDLWCVMYWPATRRGDQDKLLRIPPNRLEIQSNWLGEAVKIILKTDAGQDDVDLTDAPIAISWGWHSSSAGGVSPMVTLRAILEENRSAIEWRRQQWIEGPKFNGILTHPAAFKTQEVKDRFVQSWKDWRDSHGGGTPILENGMEYKQLTGVTPKDARDIEGRQLTDLEVCGAFYIPPELLGAREGNFSNITAFRQMLYGPILGPIFSELQQAVNQGLVGFLDATPDLYVEMDRDAAINGSFLEQARLLNTLVGAPVMTPAEGRAKLNLKHLDGTDDLIRPMNVTVGGQASPADSGDQNIKDDGEPANPVPE